jgi:D-alanyl-lipoteichoic acid acyltransferase DltB (MBOAT superfamily)
MLFNSYAFLFVFLPIVLGTFYWLRRSGWRDASVLFLTIASVAFYAYWKPADTFILLGTVVFNFIIAGLITRDSGSRARLLLVVGICANVALLVYFKYFEFLVANFGKLSVQELAPPSVIGISFFTFTQIAYLADCYQSRSSEKSFGNYALFVTIFPHLIAGPIIHHSQMRPQFVQLRKEPIRSELVLMGVIIFVIGMAKKVLLADNLAIGADAAFSPADHGLRLDMAMAWMGTIAYTLQIYFDFSGYSDMAIGLGLLFGLRLPINFDSPYKSRSIIEFWRRWHVTLSAWLRDYIYIPLGGNRNGEFGRLRNVFLTFLIGGIWHGAGWTFVIWGALHGAYVVGNHLLRKWRPPQDGQEDSLLPGAGKHVATLMLVMIAWVFFRAKTVPGAVSVLTSMALPGQGDAGIASPDAIVYFWIVIAAVLVVFAPSTQQLVRYTAKLTVPLSLGTLPLFQSLRQGGLMLSARPATAILCGLLFAASLACIWRPAIFIYFNF